MNTEKLKPCPFCGGEALSSTGHLNWTQCMTCHATAGNWNDRVPEPVDTSREAQPSATDVEYLASATSGEITDQFTALGEIAVSATTDKQES